jgi:hypothetical protein
MMLSALKPRNDPICHLRDGSPFETIVHTHNQMRQSRMCLHKFRQAFSIWALGTFVATCGPAAVGANLNALNRQALSSEYPAKLRWFFDSHPSDLDLEFAAQFGIARLKVIAPIETIVGRNASVVFYAVRARVLQRDQCLVRVDKQEEFTLSVPIDYTGSAREDEAKYNLDNLNVEIGVEYFVILACDSMQLAYKIEQ